MPRRNHRVGALLLRRTSHPRPDSELPVFAGGAGPARRRPPGRGSRDRAGERCAAAGGRSRPPPAGARPVPARGFPRCVRGAAALGSGRNRAGHAMPLMNRLVDGSRLRFSAAHDREKAPFESPGVPRDFLAGVSGRRARRRRARRSDGSARLRTPRPRPTAGRDAASLAGSIRPPARRPLS